MASFILKLPDRFGIDEGEAKMTLAVGLYKKGKLSMGQAAELVDLSKTAFMEVLALYDTDIMHFPSKELDNDLANAKDYSS